MSSLPSIQEIEDLHHKYAPNDKVYEVVYGHCQKVRDIALWCADNIEKTVDRPLLEAATLLHDLGAYVYFNEDGTIKDSRLYWLHATIGASIVQQEGLGTDIAELISTHVLLGLSKQEIIDNKWSLPANDYQPQTLEGELLCYADCFHSKYPSFNSYDIMLARWERELPLQAQKLKDWSIRFGIPDVAALAKQYNQPIK